MRAYWIALAVFLAAACSRGEAPKPAKQAASAPVLGAAQCAEPIGITTDQFFTNADAGLKNTKNPSTVLDKQVVEDPCGYLLSMTMPYGMTKVLFNKNNQVLSVFSGVELGKDVVENFKKTMTMTQVMTSPFTTEPIGSTDIGKKLISLTSKTMDEGRKSGIAQNDYEYQGMLYTVVNEGNLIAIFARKKY